MTESVKKTAKPKKAAKKSADPAETGKITESVNQEIPEKDGAETTLEPKKKKSSTKKSAKQTAASAANTSATEVKNEESALTATAKPRPKRPLKVHPGNPPSETKTPNRRKKTSLSRQMKLLNLPRKKPKPPLNARKKPPLLK